MGTLVSSGTTLTINSTYLLAADGTIASGGLFDGYGTVTGGYALVNLGTISADVGSQTLAFANATLTNQGLIEANGGILNIQSSVTDSNLSGTDLTGGIWEAAGNGDLNLLSGQIVTDDATIVFNGSGSEINGFDTGAGTLQPLENSLLTVGTAGVLDVLGGRNFLASNTLAVNGTVTLGGGTLSESGGLTIAATGAVTGFGTLDPNVSIVDSGTIDASGGTLAVPQPGLLSGAGTLMASAGATLNLLASGSNYGQTIVNNGTVAVGLAVPGFAAKLDINGPYSGSGSFLIEGGDTSAPATLQLPGTVSANVAFDSNAGRLLLDSPASFHGTLAGFSDIDKIILTGIANASTATLSGETLSIKNGSNVVEATLTLDTGSMNYNAATFGVIESGLNNSATVTVSGSQAPCYAAGTRIATQRGEVPVEQLVAGDIVLAHFAGTAPVVWIGHRYVDCLRHPSPAKVWPVLVEAHAFGPRLPHRDLLLSPDHAVFVDNVLIPVKYLVNKKTIRQIKAESITYYHIELPEHDVLLAEGLGAESYLESGSRSAFDNGGPALMLHPEFGARRWEALGCAPLVLTGAKLAAVKARLDKTAADSRSTGRRPRAA